MRKFNLTQLAIQAAPQADRPKLLTEVTSAAAVVKTAVPQYAADLDTISKNVEQVFIANVPLDAAQQAKHDQAARNVRGWYTSTCFG